MLAAGFDLCRVQLSRSPCSRDREAAKNPMAVARSYLPMMWPVNILILHVYSMRVAGKIPDWAKKPDRTPAQELAWALGLSDTDDDW